MAAEIKESNAKEQFTEYSNPMIRKICEKWCQNVSDILKESKICHKNKVQMEGKFQTGLTAKWNDTVNESWNVRQFDVKLAELHDRKVQAAGKSTESWRRFGRTPEEQTQSIRLTQLMGLCGETKHVIDKQRQTLENLICTVQQRRDLLQQISKQRESTAKQIDTHIMDTVALFAD